MIFRVAYLALQEDFDMSKFVFTVLYYFDYLVVYLASRRSTTKFVYLLPLLLATNGLMSIGMTCLKLKGTTDRFLLGANMLTSLIYMVFDGLMFCLWISPSALISVGCAVANLFPMAVLYYYNQTFYDDS